MPGARLGEAIDDDFLESSEAYAQNLVSMLTAPDIDGHEIRHIVTELSVSGCYFLCAYLSHFTGIAHVCFLQQLFKPAVVCCFFFVL